MAQQCTRSFDEELISGYLDGALPQVQAQRVRLHIEGCASCRALYDELRTLRETAMSTRFDAPADDEWPELPLTRPGRISRSLGWLVLMAWLVVVGGFSLWRLVTQSGDPLELFLMLGLPGALFLLFVSVLTDRVRDLKTDRYRGVHR
ncbi:MAG: zf-HC2 domain-containing protein [Acidobacteriota bacterium]